MTTGLYSRCMGGNSTIIAMAKWPEEFEQIEALVLLNVVSGRTLSSAEPRTPTSIPRRPPVNSTSAFASSRAFASTRKHRSRTRPPSRSPR